MTDVNAYTMGNAATNEGFAILLRTEASQRVTIKSGRPEKMVGLAGSFGGRRTIYLGADRNALRGLSPEALKSAAFQALGIDDAELRDILLFENL
ncbi:MAG: hypothetical protein GC160_00075 [Acidobacteria bacterium]|nr:hypothetical protein [Acidobacteriota bacterium]